MERVLKFRAWYQNLMFPVYEIKFAEKEIFEIAIPDNDGFPHFVDDNIILMQFTSLLDKNGKEVWEGDILKRTINMRNYADCDGTAEEIHEVRYERGYWLPFQDCGYYNLEEFEIIGNIYEGEYAKG